MAKVAVAPPQTRSASFTRFAWGVLAWNLLVALWGAYVRASGSGAGCGSHWPLCNGDVLPQAPQVKTIIEFTHRATSGIALVLTVVLALWSAVRFPKGHRLRKTAMASLVLLMVEALLGAGLVLLNYVGTDASQGRALYLSLHLTNTQFLLAALALTAWFSRDPDRPAKRRTPPAIAWTLPVAILVSVTGAIAALGDTLFPVASLAEGLRQDLSPAASFLVKLRVIHPVLAVAAAAFFCIVCVRVIGRGSKSLQAKVAIAVLVATLAQLLAGAVNIAMLAPIPIQILHLLLAYLVWTSLVLLTAESRT